MATEELAMIRVGWAGYSLGAGDTIDATIKRCFLVVGQERSKLGGGERLS